jgi:hypothetical protein
MNLCGDLFTNCLFPEFCFPRIRLMFKFHDSSFKWFPLIQFMSRWIRLCNLVLMFMFLWVSAGPTYSALPVNAKENSGLSVLDGNYSLHDIRFGYFFVHVKYWFSSSEVYLLSIFTHPCFHLVFRYKLSATCKGDGSSSAHGTITMIYSLAHYLFNFKVVKVWGSMASGLGCDSLLSHWYTIICMCVICLDAQFTRETLPKFLIMSRSLKKIVFCGNLWFRRRPGCYSFTLTWDTLAIIMKSVLNLLQHGDSLVILTNLASSLLYVRFVRAVIMTHDYITIAIRCWTCK